MATVSMVNEQPFKASAQAIEDVYREAKHRLDALRQDIKAEIKKELRTSGDRTAAKIRQVLERLRHSQVQYN